jgi:LPXTG-site transpeptidase (sortase) family protein
MTETKPQVKTVIIAFLSAVLLFVGFGTLLMLFVPVFYSWITISLNNPWQPLLPLSSARAEAFLSIDDIPLVNLYPPQPVLNPSPQTLETHTVGWVRIPAIDVSVPVALSPSLNDADVIETLIFGAALYPNGISPGHLGNTFISAHSTGEPWKGKYRFAFLRINELEPGHEIHVDIEGTRYTYRVADKELVKPSTDFRIESDRPKPTLTLMACWPLWTTNQRLLITGELANITQLTPRPS